MAKNLQTLSIPEFLTAVASDVRNFPGVRVESSDNPKTEHRYLGYQLTMPHGEGSRLIFVELHHAKVRTGWPEWMDRSPQIIDHIKRAAGRVKIAEAFNAGVRTMEDLEHVLAKNPAPNAYAFGLV